MLSILSQALLVLLFVFVLVKLKRRPPLPPGPKGRIPFAGMTFDMPKSHPWFQLAQWAREYGPLMHLRVGLQDYIYISDPQIARDLFDKRSNIYSDRPPSVVGSILSHNMRSVLISYSPEWRRLRKLFSSVLNSTRCDGYNKIEEREAIIALHDIQTNPELFAQHIHRFSLSVVRSISYGQRVVRHDDPLVSGLKKVIDQFAYAMAPGRFLVDSIPILLYLPRFLAPWRKTLEQFRDDEDSLSLANYRDTAALAEKYPNRPSIVKDIKEIAADYGDVSELQGAITCMEILSTGSDTTANSLLTTILACIAFPEVVKKAHAELDRVIGHDRFPTWQDEPNLPYIRAIIKEQHRWRTIAPMSFAHYTHKEDIYNGYRIPRGSVVRVNTWAIHRDPNRYPDPERFNPDRFLNHPLSASAYANSGDVSARDHFSYGGGKRICVGMHLAERSLFNMTSRLLHIFDIKPALDEQGNEIPPDINAFSSGLISAPLPFKVRFIVRNEAVRRLLEREWMDTARAGKPESWSDIDNASS
ncbi:cytochrome P450 [Xylogone sp. PMI_703]|nr:cytochrome P450 [Xylogone sp. PMI_703]